MKLGTTIRHILFLGALLSFGLFLNEACEEKNQNSKEAYVICGIKNPDWFMNLIDEIGNESSYVGSIIYQHTYKSNYYFHLEIPVSSCMYCRIYDCDGNLVEWSSVQDYLDNRTNEIIIWHWGD
jgi:hypothetical protein